MNRTHIVILVYAAVIVVSAVYFVALQNFGFKGLLFTVEGRDRIINPIDVLILAVTIVSLFLLFISVLAFRRTKDTRVLIVSMAFFFFAVKEILFLFENFFPGEHIYIDNAERVLELLILLSFSMLMYGTYSRTKKAAKREARRSKRE